MTMEAFDSSEFAAQVNAADLVVPDGMPVVWAMRRAGVRDQTRVYGPELMLRLCAAAAREGVPIGLYGAREQTLSALASRLSARFPGLRIAYSIAPPFRELTEDEDRAVTDEINSSGARILFVGLGCPKQERWMAAHKGRVQAVMIGVGAAFDIHAGRVPQAPPWMQRAGLEWFFRLVNEPRRLWRRYLWHNPRFVALIALQLLGLLTFDGEK
jgi:N-acetylglucosaminyldiphosphoundecaprenol N-acetyl-beta-D-mannosaminyltransferase